MYSRCVKNYGAPLDPKRKTVVLHNTCHGPKVQNAGMIKNGVKKENVCLKTEIC